MEMCGKNGDLKGVEVVYDSFFFFFISSHMVGFYVLVQHVLKMIKNGSSMFIVQSVL